MDDRVGARRALALRMVLMATAGFGAAAASAQQAQPAQGQQAQSPDSAAPKGDGKQGQTVTVTGTRQTYTADIDRRSYTIGRDLQGANGSIGDVLRNVPSVDVDLNGNVSLRGQGNVTILVDGKPSSLFKGPAGGQTLLSVPAGQYERVEVMTNPSAAFGAEGTGGIINLVSRRNNRSSGVNGSVRVTLGTGNRRGGSANVSDKIGKLTLSANAAYRRDRQKLTDVRTTTILDAAGRPLLSSREVTNGAGGFHFWTARLGADYDVDAKTRISADIHHTTFGYHSNLVSHRVGTDAGGAVAQLFDRSGLIHFGNSDTEGSLTYRRDFAGAGHNLVASITHEATIQDNSQRFDSESPLPPAPPRFDDFRSRGTLKRTEAKLDYTKPLGTTGKLQTGYDFEADGDRFDDRGGFGTDAASAAIAQPGLTELFRYDRTIEAAYVTWERSFGATSLQLGLRAEAAQADLASDGAGFHRRTADLRFFPSVHSELALNPRDKLRASLSTRIQRPDPRDLDPFRRFLDPFHFQSGNPDLKPQETYSAEFSFEHRKGATYDLLTLYVRHNERGVTSVSTDLGGGVLLTTRANLAGSDNAGAELVLNGQITKKLTYRLSGNAFWQRIDAFNLGLGRRSAFIASGKAGVDWQPDDKDLLQTNLNVIGKTLLPQGQIDPIVLVNLGYRHKLNRRLWAFLTVQDALHSFRQSNSVRTPTLIDRDVAKADTRAGFLGISYNFGGKSSRDPGFDYSS